MLIQLSLAQISEEIYEIWLPPLQLRNFSQQYYA
jgi:hypothetical protein